MDPHRNVCVAIPRDLHLKLRRYALEHDLTLAEIVQRLLRDLLEPGDGASAATGVPIVHARKKGGGGQ